MVVNTVKGVDHWLQRFKARRRYGCLTCPGCSHGVWNSACWQVSLTFLYLGRLLVCCVLTESSFFLRIFLHIANIKNRDIILIAKGFHYEMLHHIFDVDAALSLNHSSAVELNWSVIRIKRLLSSFFSCNSPSCVLLMGIASGWIISVVCVLCQRGWAQSSTGPHSSSRPNCLTSAWHR